MSDQKKSAVQVTPSPSPASSPTTAAGTQKPPETDATVPPVPTPSAETPPAPAPDLNGEKDKVAAVIEEPPFQGAENIPANWTITPKENGITAVCVSGRVFTGDVKVFSSKFSR